MLRTPSVLLLMMSVSACASSGQSPPLPAPVATSANEYCLIAKPIYLDSKDVLTKDTLDQILGENAKGQRLCGWKPPGK